LLDSFGAASTGNALYLRTVLDELRQWGDHFTLGEQMERYLAAPDLAALYGVVLDRYEGDFERDRPALVADALRFVWAARRGLTEAELLDALGRTPGRRRAPPRVLVAPSSSLSSRTSSPWARASRSPTSHCAPRFEARYVTRSSVVDAHSRLADHLLADGALTERVLDEVPHQLGGAERWDDLAEWLTRPEAFDALYPPRPCRSAHRVDAGRGPLCPPGAGRLRPPARRCGARVPGRGCCSRFRGEYAASHPSDERSRQTDNAALGEHPRLMTCLIDRGAWQLQTGDKRRRRWRRTTRHTTSPSRRPTNLARSTRWAARRRSRARRAIGQHAIALLVQQEQLARQLGQIGDVERALGSHAAVLSDLGDFTGAVTMAVAAEAAAREVGDPQLLSAALLVRSTSSGRAGRHRCGGRGRRHAGRRWHAPSATATTACAWRW